VKPFTIADVGAVARDFGLDPALLQAGVRAEGDIVRGAALDPVREDARRGAAN
jgi:hypothetical protein